MRHDVYTISRPTREGRVIVPGMWDSKRSLEPLATELAGRGSRTAVVDLRGRDDSKRASKHGVRTLDYVDDVLSALRQCQSHQYGPPVLYGKSGGAVWAARAASEYPDLVRALVLVTPGAANGIRVLSWETLRTMLLWPPYLWALATGARFRIRAKDAEKLLLGETKAERGVVDEFVKTSESGHVLRDLVFSRVEIEPRVPTLIVAAERDVITPRQVAKEMMATVPVTIPCRYLELSGEDHSVFLEEKVEKNLEPIESALADLLSPP